MHQFRKDDTICIYNEQKNAIQAMLDYDYLCNKNISSIICIIDPLLSGKNVRTYFYGAKEVYIPVFGSLTQAAEELTPTIFVNFASERSAFAVTMEALHYKSIEKLIVIAEGVPERDARLLKYESDKLGKVIIGPATVGCLIGGIAKIGNAGGTTENVLENRLQERGNIGIVSKSGGMLNELMTIVSRCSNGVCEAVTIGGDRFPCSTLAEVVYRYENNEDIKLILLLGELGGVQEYAVVDAIKQGKVKKPIIAWVSGQGARVLGTSVQFGHAGAKANGLKEKTEEKLKTLRECGVIVPDSFAELEETVRREASRLGLQRQENTPVVHFPADFKTLLARGEVRYEKQFMTSISKKIGVDESYLGRDIAEVSSAHSLGYILGLLWFKTEFPEDICHFFELVLKVCADHGPSVSGAQNTIIASRAGKDLVSSLAAGLLTIGPRFGGAVNDAAYYFKMGADTALAPYRFVEDMKKNKMPIPGIGHKVKSKTNPDKRVSLLKSEAYKLPINHTYLSYACTVEEVTTRKKDSLILNVDGAIASSLLDILCSYLKSDTVDELIHMEALNGFFVTGRTLGLIGHFIDQKRLKQPLYRHPEWDILEI